MSLLKGDGEGLTPEWMSWQVDGVGKLIVSVELILDESAKLIELIDSDG